jgi:hypothetical protein
MERGEGEEEGWFRGLVLSSRDELDAAALTPFMLMLLVAAYFAEPRN